MKTYFFEAHREMAENFKNEFRSLVGKNIKKIEEMFADWKSGDRPVECVKDEREIGGFPYHSFPEETNFLIMSKLSKEIKCTDGNGCPPNFVNDAKRTWFDEMKKMIIKMKNKLGADEKTCEINIMALEDDGFTQMKIAEQENILAEIEGTCLSNLYDKYKKWYGFYGKDGKCQAELGGTYITDNVSEIDGKCPGKYF